MKTNTIPVPNACTLKAMKELDQGKGKRFSNAEEMFQDLGLQRPARKTLVGENRKPSIKRTGIPLSSKD